MAYSRKAGSGGLMMCETLTQHMALTTNLAQLPQDTVSVQLFELISVLFLLFISVFSASPLLYVLCFSVLSLAQSTCVLLKNK